MSPERPACICLDGVETPCPACAPASVATPPLPAEPVASESPLLGRTFSSFSDAEIDALPVGTDFTSSDEDPSRVQTTGTGLHWVDDDLLGGARTPTAAFRVDYPPGPTGDWVLTRVGPELAPDPNVGPVLIQVDERLYEWEPGNPAIIQYAQGMWSAWPPDPDGKRIGEPGQYRSAAQAARAVGARLPDEVSIDTSRAVAESALAALAQNVARPVAAWARDFAAMPESGTPRGAGPVLEKTPEGWSWPSGLSAIVPFEGEWTAFPDKPGAALWVGLYPTPTLAADALGAQLPAPLVLSRTERGSYLWPSGRKAIWATRRGARWMARPDYARVMPPCTEHPTAEAAAQALGVSLAGAEPAKEGDLETQPIPSSTGFWWSAWLEEHLPRDRAWAPEAEAWLNASFNTGTSTLDEVRDTELARLRAELRARTVDRDSLNDAWIWEGGARRKAEAQLAALTETLEGAEEHAKELEAERERANRAEQALLDLRVTLEQALTIAEELPETGAGLRALWSMFERAVRETP